jgi:glycosyltransferase involved in cell wall biosynthesis
VQRRPRILVLNQYYRPGVEATANLLADLCEGLADEYDVTVVTGRIRGKEGLPTDEILNGVRVLRTRSTAYDRAELHHRALNYLTYLGDSLLRGLTLKRPDLVVCMTDPPIVGALAVQVARRYRAPLLVISQDVFPEIATELGRLTNRRLISTLRRLVGYYLARADHIVAIGDRMRERLIAKGARADRVTVIPNWVDTEAIRPLPQDNTWARDHRLANFFLVMHSGNVGHAQNLDNLVFASTFLRDLEDLWFPIVGFGARHMEVSALAERLEANRVFFLPYQPRETLAESLSSADVHYVGLAKGLSGYVVPSRIYGILAAGRPVVVAADADSETARLVESVGCGVVVPPDRPELIAAALRDAYDGKLDLDGMGKRGRAWVEREGGRAVAIERYRRLIAEVISGSKSGTGTPFHASSDR